MTYINEATVERMVRLVRRIALQPLSDAGVEARAIVALLPEPVDPDLVEARQVVIDTLAPENHARCNCREEIANGGWDSGQKVRASLAAIKRGRELARQDKSRE